MYVLSR